MNHVATKSHFLHLYEMFVLAFCLCHNFRALKPLFPIDGFFCSILNWLCVMQYLNHNPTMAIKSNCTNNSLMKYVWMHRNSKCIYVGLKHWMAWVRHDRFFFHVFLSVQYFLFGLSRRHGKLVGRCSGDIRSYQITALLAIFACKECNERAKKATAIEFVKKHVQKQRTSQHSHVKPFEWHLLK